MADPAQGVTAEANSGRDHQTALWRTPCGPGHAGPCLGDEELPHVFPQGTQRKSYIYNRGAVVAQWIRPQTLNREVPGLNLLAAAVVLLGKALYPHCIVPRKGLKSPGCLLISNLLSWWPGEINKLYKYKIQLIIIYSIIEWYTNKRL